MKVFGVLIVSLMAIACTCRAAKLSEKFAWKEMTFAWPSDEMRLQAIAAKAYIPENNLPLGLEKWQNKLFITVPRWKTGVASSLNYIDLDESVGNKSPTLYPYPAWSNNFIDENSANNSDSIISTFRVRADECDRLWVMDTGTEVIFDDPVHIKNPEPAIVIFDLKTNTLIRRFIIPAGQSTENSFYANIIVDTEAHRCGDAFAYMPDLGGYGLIVYSFRDNKSWRVKHNYFHFDPLQGDYNVAGVNFQWTDGIFALALGRPAADGKRTVYFHAFSSTKEFAVANTVLKNETYASSREAFHDFKLLGDRGSNGQSSAEFLDPETNVLFYTQVNKDGVGCWNVEKPYTPDTQGLVDSDSNALVFPNDLKVDTNGTLWVLSDKMPLFLFRTLNPDEVNYRIMQGDTKEIIDGTPCGL